MPLRSGRLRAASLVLAAGVTTLGLASTGVSGATAAPGADGHRPGPGHGPAQPVSTPVPIATPDGVVSSYVLNTRLATPGITRVVERAARRAGGVVVQSWPQIGVLVVHSDRAAFRADVRRAAGPLLASVGATRTVAVTEGTPEGVASSWDPGRRASSDLRQRAERRTDTTGAERTVAATPDPREGEQWDLKMIKADQAHEITDGSRKVVVGVLDSGIDPDHPDLAANIDTRDSVNCTDAGRPDTSPTGWYPTTSDHGTHVAGTIAAARNGVGIVGVAPGVRLAAVKVVNDDGFIYPEYAVCGFVWAGQHGFDVTNNSYYVDPFQFYCSDQPDQAAAKEAVRRAVAWSTKQGVVHAAAAGNSSYDLANKTTDATSPDDGTPIERTINNECQDIPTELPGVVTVSSLERFPADTLENRLSGFSNRGLGVIDVAAPGSRILSTVVADNGYGLKSGTSMATPHVAGVLALMKSAHPRWSPARMVERLRAQADDHACGTATAGAPCVGDARNNSYSGEGVVDALDAVR
ncbi:S8 family serine peptidase [Nocardioides sp.]|uniref:S8 family peptidase n=1 Tax=Nocardioides sp. TaxID=35761 RepID=UPI003513543B